MVKITNCEEITAVGHDLGKNLLFVEFASGAIYQYDRVYQIEFLLLIGALDTLAVFNTRIRDYKSYKCIKGPWKRLMQEADDRAVAEAQDPNA